MTILKEYERLGKMLASIISDFDPESTKGKALIVRAALGMTDVAPVEESKTMALCECGWQGTFADCKLVPYDSGEQSWRMRGGRKGEHWLCPQCHAVVWKHYWLIN